MVARLGAGLAWTLAAMLIQAVLLLLPGRGKERFALVYWRGIAFCLGVRLTVRGRLAAHRPALYIVNHCSWLDIVVLGSVLPGCFVAKAAVAQWPLIGWIAKLGRTIFVSRNRASVQRERTDLEARLAAGDNIILFPEGTTSDGARVMKFAPAFLSLADAPAKPWVQAVTLVYDRLDNMPVRLCDRPEIAWYGDMELASHFNRIGRRRRIHATIILDPPLAPGTFGDRKMLAAAMEARIALTAAALRQGRSIS